MAPIFKIKPLELFLYQGKKHSKSFKMYQVYNINKKFFYVLKVFINTFEKNTIAISYFY